MNVKIEDLKISLLRVLQHLQETRGSVISIEKDAFWSIGPQERYDLYRQPVQLEVGSLADAVKETAELCEGSREPLGLDLVNLGYLLVSIGEENMA